MQLRANRGTEMESEGENSYAADQGETLSGFCAALYGRYFASGDQL